MLSSSPRGVSDDEAFATACTVNRRKRKSSTSTADICTEEYIALLAQRRRPASHEVGSALSYSLPSRQSDETPNNQHHSSQLPGPHDARPSGMQRLLQPFGSDTYNNLLPSSSSCYEAYHEHPHLQADSSSTQLHHAQPISSGSRPPGVVIPPQTEPLTVEQDSSAFERELTLQQDVLELLHPERRYYQGTSMPVTGWFHPCRFCRTWTSGCINFQDDDIAVCKGCEIKLTEYYTSFLQVLLATNSAPPPSPHLTSPTRPRLARRPCRPSPAITPAVPSPCSTSTCYSAAPDATSSPLPPYHPPAFYLAPASLAHKQAPVPSSRLQHVTGPSHLPNTFLPPASDLARPHDQNPAARPHLKQPCTRPSDSHVSSTFPLHPHPSASLPPHQGPCPSLAAADASCMSSYSPALTTAPAPAVAAGGRSFRARASAAAAAAAAAVLGGGYSFGPSASAVAAGISGDYGAHLSSIERLAAAAAAVGVNVSSYAVPRCHSPAEVAAAPAALPRGGHGGAPGSACMGSSWMLEAAGQLPTYQTLPYAQPAWR